MDLFDSESDYPSDDEDEGLPWDQPFNPAWTPPLRNFNVGTTIYRWYRMEHYTGDFDVTFVECGYPYPRDEASVPEWMADDDPYEEFYRDSSEGYHDYDTAKYTWGLRHGVSLGQPFLLAFQKPRYSGGGRSYDGEYEDVDVDIQYDVVRRLPRTERSALRSWEHLLERIRQAKERYERCSEHFRRLRMALTHRWTVRVDHFGRDNEIIEIKILINIPGDTCMCLAYGRSGDTYLIEGKWKKEPKDPTQAFWRLVDHFIELHPGVSLDPVLRLAGSPVLERHKIEVSRWDYLRLQYGEDHSELRPVDELL